MPPDLRRPRAADSAGATTAAVGLIIREDALRRRLRPLPALGLERDGPRGGIEEAAPLAGAANAAVPPDPAGRCAAGPAGTGVVRGARPACTAVAGDPPAARAAGAAEVAGSRVCGDRQRDGAHERRAGADKDPTAVAVASLPAPAGGPAGAVAARPTGAADRRRCRRRRRLRRCRHRHCPPRRRCRRWRCWRRRCSPCPRMSPGQGSSRPPPSPTARSAVRAIAADAIAASAARADDDTAPPCRRLPRRRPRLAPAPPSAELFEKRRCRHGQARAGGVEDPAAGAGPARATVGTIGRLGRLSVPARGPRDPRVRHCPPLLPPAPPFA